MRYYVSARGIKDLNTLLSCLVSDRLRAAINDPNCLRYICALEDSKDGGWLEHLTLARSIDHYYANSPSGQRYVMTTTGSAPVRSQSTMDEQPRQTSNNQTFSSNDPKRDIGPQRQSPPQMKQMRTGNLSMGAMPEVTCYYRAYE